MSRALPWLLVGGLIVWSVLQVHDRRQDHARYRDSVEAQVATIAERTEAVRDSTARVIAQLEAAADSARREAERQRVIADSLRAVRALIDLPDPDTVAPACRPVLDTYASALTLCDLEVTSLRAELAAAERQLTAERAKRRADSVAAQAVQSAYDSVTVALDDALARDDRCVLVDLAVVQVPCPAVTAGLDVVDREPTVVVGWTVWP